MNKSSFEEILDKNECLVYSNSGRSMLPLIREHKDVLLIEKKKRKCEVNDVVLYKRDGKYILHRVIAVNGNSLVILGDNNRRKEYDIKDDDVFGILKEIKRGRRVITVNNKWYRLYVYLWVKLPLRYIYQLASKIIRKICQILNG